MKIIAAILVLGTGLRLYHLGFQSYWIDEMVSLYFTTRPAWGDIFLDNHPILYHFILKLWVMVFGTSEFATRFLSVIFSLLATWGVYKVALKITKEKKWALIAGAFHAVSVFSIIYAQETRMYALFEMATVLNLYFFFELFFEKKTNRHSWIGFIISCFILAASHYGGIVLLVFEAIYLLSLKTKTRKWILVGIGTGIFITLISYFYQFSWWALEWQKTKYMQEPMARTPLEALIYLSNLSIFNLIFYVVFFAFAYWQLHKNKSQRRIFFWLFGIIAFSLLVLQMASSVTQRSLMLPRYFIFLNPVWILLFTYCLSVLKRKTVWIWAGGVALVAILWLPVAYLNIKAPWKEAASRITQDELKPSVLTTRTLAIAVPYLEQKSVPIDRLTVAEITDSFIFEKRIKKGESVWIMENYWGSINYLPKFITNLKKTKLNVEEFKFQNPMSDPVLLIRITR